MMGSEMSPYAKRIQHGLALANRKLMERNALLGDSLVVGSLDGTCKNVDAKDFLKESKDLPWWKENFSD